MIVDGFGSINFVLSGSYGSCADTRPETCSDQFPCEMGEECELVGVSVGARWTVLILEASVESRFVLQWTVESTLTVVVTVCIENECVVSGRQ